MPDGAQDDVPCVGPLRNLNVGWIAGARSANLPHGLTHSLQVRSFFNDSSDLSFAIRQYGRTGLPYRIVVGCSRQEQSHRR
jgi:hypothetical protein